MALSVFTELCNCLPVLGHLRRSKRSSRAHPRPSCKQPPIRLLSGFAFSILSLSPRMWWCIVLKRRQSLSRWAASGRSWGSEEACWGGVRAADPTVLLTESPGGGALTESLYLNFKTCLYLASQVALEITELLMPEEPHLPCLTWPFSTITASWF